MTCVGDTRKADKCDSRIPFTFVVAGPPVLLNLIFLGFGYCSVFV